MYTVKELIETLSQCPEDYTVLMDIDWEVFQIEQVGIYHNEQTVKLFSN